MTRYQRIAELDEEEDSNLEIWEAAEYLNGDTDPYRIMWVNDDVYFLVREDENGDVYVGATFDAFEDIDDLGETDKFASQLEGEPYYVVEFPRGNRKFAWFDE